MGTWINPDGYNLRKLRVEYWPRPGMWSPWRKTIYEFQLDLARPLTYRSDDGWLWQPDRHQDETDLGSIPPPLRSLFPQDEYVWSYLLHDGACRDRGLYMSPHWEQPFVFVRLTSGRVHALLRESCRAEGASWARAWLIWRAVERFGPDWA